MRASQGCARSAFLQEGLCSMLWIRRTKAQTILTPPQKRRVLSSPLPAKNVIQQEFYESVTGMCSQRFLAGRGAA